MPKYEIEATRETLYLFQDVEAETEEEARKLVELEMLEKLGGTDLEDFAVDWYPVEITGIYEQND